MSVSISPVFNGIQFFDNAGLPLSGGLIYQYEAGSRYKHIQMVITKLRERELGDKDDNIIKANS